MTDNTKDVISKLFIEHSMHTNQALINDLVVLVEQARAKGAIEERERSAKVSYDKMSQEIAPFTPKIFSTITSTEGKWE